MRLTINIELGNDAMRSREDVWDALGRTFDSIHAEDGWDAPEPGNEGGIRDLSGNRVGAWKVVEV